MIALKIVHRFFSQISLFLSYRLYLLIPGGGFLKILYLIAPWAIFRSHKSKDPIRDGLYQMGPIFIKFGQFLSMRSDLFSEHTLSQLQLLCDHVPLSDFAWFDNILDDLAQTHHFTVNKKPLAAASIAQVYEGTLPNGEAIVIKIQKPDLRNIVASDLLLLELIGFLLCCVLPARYEVRNVLKRFKNTLWHEMNFKREAAQADALRMGWEKKVVCRIPKIYWNFVTEHILIMEKVKGIPFRILLNCGLDSFAKKRIALKLYHIFLYSVFHNGLFHADLHPGNIFFDLSQDQFWFVDFGIVSRIEKKTHWLLCRKILALLKKDYAALASLFIDNGWSTQELSLLERQNFEWSLHVLIAPWHERSLKDISLSLFLKELIDLAGVYHIKVQPELVLLHKTIFVVEGLLRDLYPEINLIKEGIDPIMSAISAKYGPLFYIKDYLDQASIIMS